MNEIFFKKTDIERIIKQYDEDFSFSNQEASQTETKIEPLQNDGLQCENQQLKAEIERFKTELQQAHDEIARLKAEIENAQSSPLFDPSNEYTYPPELDECFKIWNEIYINNSISPHITEHSAKFTHAVKKLGIRFNSGSHEERLRTVTTPKAKKDKTRK